MQDPQCLQRSSLLPKFRAVEKKENYKSVWNAMASPIGARGKMGLTNSKFVEQTKDKLNPGAKNNEN